MKIQIKDVKSAGPDDIPPEVIKRCDIDDIILAFSNALIERGKKPDQLSIADIIPLPKVGNLSNVTNYRGISLSSIVTKIINKMVLNRIQTKIDLYLRPNQNGFRPGRSTTAHILALRRLIEEVKSKNKKASIIFVDFCKAFHSIQREKMLTILIKMLKRLMTFHLI